MLSIAALGYPSCGDLGHTAEQRLSRSIDYEQVVTQDSRLDHFLKFVKRYNLQDKYLSQDEEFMDDMMTCYVTFMLSGFAIQSREVLVSTIKGYLRAFNTYYKTKRLRVPYDPKAETPANSRLLKDQEKLEDAPGRREPLPDKVLVKMCELGKADLFGF